MRTSSYVFFAPNKDDNSCILLQGMFGYLDKVPERVAEFLRSTENLTESDVLQYHVSQEELTLLARRGYLTNLTPSREQALFQTHIARLHAKNIAGHEPCFTIIPSYSCNLRCPYCFQDHAIHSGHDIISSSRIYELYSAIDEIRGRFRSGRQSTQALTLFGGEPFLGRYVTNISELIEEGLARGYRFRAITNGVELDHYWPLLRTGALIQLQVTLDGPSSIHDRRRISAEYPQTFDLIAGNVSRALDLGVQVSLRMNVDQSNAYALHSLVAEFDKRGWTRNKHFSFYSANVTASQRYRSGKLLDGAELFTILSNHSDQKNSGMHECHSRPEVDVAVKAYFETGRIPLTTTATCSANLGYFILDLFGDIYACEDEAGKQECRIGIFNASGVSLEDSATAQWWDRHIGTIEECSRCPVAMLCGGGCAYSAKMSQGDYKRAHCDGFREIIARTLPLAYATQAELHTYKC